MQQPMSQEVVLTYKSPAPQEVVLTYRAPFKGKKPPQKRPKKGKGLFIFLISFAVVLGLAVAICVWNYLATGHGPTYDATANQEITIPVYDTQGDGAVMTLQAFDQDVLTPQEVYAQVNPAVVTILSEIGGVSMSLGTGVIYSQDGYVVTNHHVVEGASSCAVALSSGDILQAYYVASDEENDLAVLKVNGQGFPTAAFAQSDFLTVGDTVYAIGNPLGLELRGTFTDGLVSAINRDVEVNGRTMSTLIQTNAALNSGNSGGPLINAYGQVVGINTVKMGNGSLDTSTASIEGIGFAIPSATVQRIVQDLVTVGEVLPEPIFGVSVGLIPATLPDGTTGAEIYSVTPGSPAHDAGVELGDIFLTMNGESVTDSNDVLRVRRQLRVGDTVEVVLWRNGRILTLDLYLDQI